LSKREIAEASFCYGGFLVEKAKIPTHIAIIMDGNGRWAKRKGLPRSEGHRRGLAVIREIVEACMEFGVKYLTLYAFSTENWKRSSEEVDFLMRTCESVITKELPFLLKEDIRFKHIGSLDGLSESLKSCIRSAMELTKNNRRLCLELAFNYGSRLEIVEAVKEISRWVKEGALAVSEITPETVSRFLYTGDVPDPDLLIRTSGEMRLSNFLLWQVCYAELYVTKKYWPDFSRRSLWRAICEYQKRQRRFGGVHD
jgi:undecaprenyl diphosphate synthase